MTSFPYFSIVIPVYNRAAILPETVNSVQDQSFNDWELIVVDDGSTDQTSQVVEAMQKADSRIRYVYQDNAERSAARNRGADHAYGKYLLFLDSDDAFSKDHLQTLFDLIQHKQEPVAMFVANHRFITETGIEEPVIPRLLPGDEFKYVLLQPITPSRVCIHKDIFEKFRFDPRIVIVEDLVLWTCIASEFPVFQSDKYTVLYRLHEGNSVDLSRNSYKNRYDGLVLFFTDEKYKPVSQNISPKLKKHLLAECSFNMARHFEFVKNFRQMNRMLLLSFRHNPFYRNKERFYMFLKRLWLGRVVLKFAGKNV